MVRFRRSRRGWRRWCRSLRPSRATAPRRRFSTRPPRPIGTRAATRSTRSARRWRGSPHGPGRTALTRMPSAPTSWPTRWSWCRARPWTPHSPRIRRESPERGGRGHIDDDAARAAVPRGHPAHRLAGAQERADHIGLHDALQPRGVHLLHAHLRFQDAGVVHQRGDRPQLAVRGVEQARMPASVDTSRPRPRRSRPARGSRRPPPARGRRATCSSRTRRNPARPRAWRRRRDAGWRRSRS